MANMVLTDDVNGLIGPLTRAAVVEILFRVKEFSLSGSATTDDDGTVTIPSVPVMTRVAPATEIFAIEQIINHDLDYLDDGSTTAINLFEIAAGDGYGEMIYELGTGSRTHMVGMDEDGGFWLFPLFYGGWMSPRFSAHGGVTFATSIYATYDPEITATLHLASGDFPIKMRAGEFITSSGTPVTSADITISATEWFPFATKSGAAAWDTAAGHATNGGPAA